VKQLKFILCSLNQYVCWIPIILVYFICIFIPSNYLIHIVANFTIILMLY
jgi:hypothetical protein